MATYRSATKFRGEVKPKPSLAELFAETHPEFQASISDLAIASKVDTLKVFSWWREYAKANHDQSVLLSEFEPVLANHLRSEPFWWAYAAVSGKVTLVKCATVDGAACERDRLKYSDARIVGYSMAPMTEAEMRGIVEAKGWVVETVR